MRLHKLATLTVATLLMSALGACGGGDSGQPLSSGPLGGASNGTLTVNTGTTTLPAGSYGLDTTQPGSSGTEQLLGKTLEVVLPFNATVPTGFLFMQSDTSKYFIGVNDEASLSEDAYGCRSASWSNAELTALATLLEDDTILNTAICTATVSIDAARHRLQVNQLTLKGIDKPSQSIRVSMNVSWALQSGSPLTGSGTGSGTGVSTSSGSASGTLTSAFSTLP